MVNFSLSFQDVFRDGEDITKYNFRTFRFKSKCREGKLVERLGDWVSSGGVAAWWRGGVAAWRSSERQGSEEQRAGIVLNLHGVTYAVSAVAVILRTPHPSEMAKDRMTTGPLRVNRTA